MLKATLKSLLAHKLRLLLTAVAVVLGVMLVTGTFVLSDTIKTSINNLFTQGIAGKAVVVRGVAPFSGNGPGAEGGAGFGGNARPLTPESLLPAIRAVPGVAAADGQVQGTFTLVGSDGKAVSATGGGAPTLGFAWDPYRPLSALVLRSGSAPTNAGELVIDAKTAKSKKLSVGSHLTVVANQGPQPFTVVGIFGYGTQDTVAGATIVAFDTATAQQQVGKPGQFTEIDIAATSGTDVNALVTAIGKILPAHYESISAAAATAQQAASLDSFLSTLSDALLAFGLIALFVGSFIIFNTFNILIGQRTRELALLRALGASRRQVITSVMGEALITGLAGALLGLVLGYLIALGLYSALKSTLSLGSVSMQLFSRTVYFSVGLGTAVTLVSALWPAVRASRVPPVAAMGDDFVLPESSLRRRAFLGTTVSVVGILLLAGGLLGKKSVALVGLGCAVTFIGSAMLLTFIAGPLARLIGFPLPRLQGIPGRLGRENSARSPRRTAATASALMVGVAVVAAIATIASSLLASFDNIFDSAIQSNYVISTTRGTFPAVATETALRAVPGVTAMSGFTSLSWHDKGAAHAVDGIDPVQGPQVLQIRILQGSISALSQGQLLIDDTTRDSQHLKVGDSLTMTFAATGDKTVTIGGVFRANQLLSEGYVASTALISGNANVVNDFFILLRTSTTSAAQQASLKAALANYPDVKVQTAAEFKKDQENSVKTLLNIVYALLFLSIIVALFGVVNTLVLSVFERTREIGLLRAIGMHRRQVRRMIRGEAVVVSLLGAVIGLILGMAFGAALVPSLVGPGSYTKLAIPFGTIIVVLIAAAVFGVIAAIWPAHRASRLDVLQAISTV